MMPTGDWFPAVHPAGCRCSGCNVPAPFFQSPFALVSPISVEPLPTLAASPLPPFLSRIRVRRSRKGTPR